MSHTTRSNTNQILTLTLFHPSSSYQLFDVVFIGGGRHGEEIGTVALVDSHPVCRIFSIIGYMLDDFHLINHDLVREKMSHIQKEVRIPGIRPRLGMNIVNIYRAVRAASARSVLIFFALSFIAKIEVTDIVELDPIPDLPFLMLFHDLGK